MSKFLYPIYKLKTKSYIKWWLYHKKAGGSGILSEILEGFSFNLENTLNRKFKLFEIEGNSTQETNLFDGQLSQGTLDSTGAEVDSVYRIRTTNYIEVVGGTTIPVRAQSSKEIQYLVYVFNNSKEVITTMGWNDINTSQTLQLNAKYIKLLFRHKDGSEISTSNVTNIVVGDTPNPNYEQPILSSGDNGSINEKITNSDGTEEQDYSIFVQQPFRSIGDVRDCFVKKNGTWYERHYKRLIFDGTENWQFSTGSGVAGIYMLNPPIDDMVQGNFLDGLSNYFHNDKSGKGKNSIRFGANNNVIYIYVDSNEFPDKTSFTSWLAEKYANGTPLYIDYIPENPTYLPCTETQIQQLENKPSTYKDFTIINSEDETPAYLKIQYYKEG